MKEMALSHTMMRFFEAFSFVRIWLYCLKAVAQAGWMGLNFRRKLIDYGVKITYGMIIMKVNVTLFNRLNLYLL